MKKTIRSIKILTVLCVVFLGIYCLLKNIDFNEEEVKLMLYQLDTIETIEIENEAGNVSLIKEEDWVDQEDEHFPLNTTKVNYLEKQIKALEYTRKYENPKELSEYGLDEGRVSLLINQDVMLIFGNETVDEEVYCMIQGEDSVYTVDQTFVSLLNKTKEEYIQLNQIENVSEETLELFEYSSDEFYASIYSTIDDEENVIWTLEKKGYVKTLSDEEFSSFASLLENLSITGWINYYAGAEELEEYGLDGSTTLTIQASSETTHLILGNSHENETAVLFEGENLVECVDAEVLQELLEMLQGL